MTRVLAELAKTQPESPALLAPGRLSLTFRQLAQHIQDTSLALLAAGIGRGDTIPIVLPNGPEMAAAFLAVMATCTAAPLNPAYQEAEFIHYFTDLQAKAVILGASDDTPAHRAAKTLGLDLIQLRSSVDWAAGLFALDLPRIAKPKQPNLIDDCALVLHTSGTTAKPKIVPLTQRNLLISAQNVAATLQLSPHDRCLNVMPLFHIHGQVAALLASLVSGASVICTEGFLAPNFFNWIGECRPTWYTAVPTMHQSILRLANEEPERAISAGFRMIRSSSSALPPQVMNGLEEAFRAPVIEAYGMTEAAHQMASNPLPPLPRKPGSVGLPAGPQVTILTEDGKELPIGTLGEVAIKGPNVMGGYLENPEADARSFSNGWFRTGDLGYLDQDGYLFLTGRLKELINHGGEKVSPREVDEVLLDHPQVEQAVTFAIPHPSLGEDVGAVVVLKSDVVTEKELRTFTSERLAHFKVPSRIVIVPEIPKGPTGKVQRIGLAEKLGITSLTQGSTSISARGPETETEQILLSLWQKVLGKSLDAVTTPFLTAGGDSMLAARLTILIHETFAIDLTIIDLMDAATIVEQAALVEKRIIAEINTLSDEEVEKLLRDE